MLALSGINSQLSFSKWFVPGHSSIAVTSRALACPLPNPLPRAGLHSVCPFFPVSFAISARLPIQGAAPHTSSPPSSKEDSVGSHHPYPQLEAMLKEGRMLTRTQTLTNHWRKTLQAVVREPCLLLWHMHQAALAAYLLVIIAVNQSKISIIVRVQGLFLLGS